MSNEQFPSGWDEVRVQRVLDHYDSQSDAVATAEDEATFKKNKRTVIEVPVELVPTICVLLHERQTKRKATAPRKRRLTTQR